MLEVALDTVLLVVCFVLVAHEPTQLVNWKVKFAMEITTFDGEVLSDKSDTVEFAFDFVYSRAFVINEWFNPSDGFSKGKALVDMLHKLLFSLVRHHTRLYHGEIHISVIVFLARFSKVTNVAERIAKNRFAALLYTSL